MISCLGLNTQHHLQIRFQFMKSDFIRNENVFENPFMGAFSDASLSFT